MSHVEPDLQSLPCGVVLVDGVDWLPNQDPSLEATSADDRSGFRDEFRPTNLTSNGM